MKLRIPFAYAPNLTWAAKEMLPFGVKVEFGDFVTVDVPELSGEDAPVVLKVEMDNYSARWRKSESGWLRPLGLDTSLMTIDSKPLDDVALVELAAAGFAPVKDSLMASSTLVQGDALQRIAAGKAVFGMAKRSGRTDLIRDDGDREILEQIARMKWEAAESVLVDGILWHAVKEPVMVRYQGNKIFIVPADAKVAKDNLRGNAYSLDDWELAADAIEADGFPRPTAPFVLSEPEALRPAMFA